MVSVSSKGIYALAAMYVLAHATGQRAMQIKEIAAMTAISHGYLEQILSVLRKADLVTSIRGAGGGYRLARRPSEITALEIIEVMEGPLFQMPNNVGSSSVLEAFWAHIREKSVELFDVKLSEFEQFLPSSYYEI